MSHDLEHPGRRAFLGAGVLASAASVAAKAAPHGDRVIATEESFNIPEIAAATGRFLSEGGATREPGFAALVAGFSPDRGREWSMNALDFAAIRARDMAAAGIDTQLLLLSAPGVQIFDPAEGTVLAALANDRMAEVQRRAPARFAALATLAPQEPEAAARELERAVRKLGLHGGLINSHTRGEYLDQPRFRPILEAAEALGAPIYIHPRDPSPQMVDAYRAHSTLGPIWGFAAETGLHALRMILAGVFDEFPKLTIVLGHLGEGLPFHIDRVDTRYVVDGSPARRKLQLRPGDYLRRNFALTTSGMNFAAPVRHAMLVMGAERVMYAADWPFEDAVAATRGFMAIPMSRRERALLLHANAERIFGIPA